MDSPSAEFLFETEMNAGVRTAAFLKRQTDETLSKIRTAVIEGTKKFYDGNSYRLKFCGCVVGGTRK